MSQMLAAVATDKLDIAVKQLSERKYEITYPDGTVATTLGRKSAETEIKEWMNRRANEKGAISVGKVRWTLL